MLNKIEFVYNTLNELYPFAKCELVYHNLYELCISVILSAQTTDKKVNIVTIELFNKYPDLDSLSQANESEVKSIINILGLAFNKAKNIIGFAKEVKKKHQGIIPDTFEELIQLPGVGHKTALVILAEWFNQDKIAVDTHVERVSKRLGLVEKNAPTIKVETVLNEIIPSGKKKKMHHLLIHFGRYQCKSQKPECLNCQLSEICLYNKE